MASLTASGQHDSQQAVPAASTIEKENAAENIRGDGRQTERRRKTNPTIVTLGC
jgi:hypothetical protein